MIFLQILVSFKRILALQKLQPWPQVSLSTSSSQNSLAKTEKSPKSSYSDLDRKILQLCGKLCESGSEGRCRMGKEASASWPQF